MPKPLDFNYFQMQWFPDYPFTEKAIEDGYITEEDTKSEALIVKTETEWAYIPKLKFGDRKTILSNIIWLLVWGRASDKVINYAVYNGSIGSKICLHYLNIQAYISGKVFGVGGLVWKYDWIKRGIGVLRYLSRGDIKGCIAKIASVIKSSTNEKKFDHYNTDDQSAKSMSVSSGLEMNEARTKSQ
jgi:hypothetical protein